MHNNKLASTRPVRPPQDNIPKTKQQRNQLFQLVREYVEQKGLVAPLSFVELQTHCHAIISSAKVHARYRDFLAILINNEVWSETVAGIAFNKRLLLLPKCLREQEKCPADFDELGLVCECCGQCIIGDLKGQAEQLGYAVLIAEGSPIVMSLIESGKIEAVVGVSCMAVLEKTFPYMEAGAIPGIAIPLLYDGCVNTAVDIDWVWDAIYQSSDDRTRRLDPAALRIKVDALFTKQSLEPVFAASHSQTEELALQWMAKAGKRWRPFLAVCAYKAISEDDDPAIGYDLANVALAVECFHKASLIHDDIEDGDVLRYGEKTLYVEYGVPIALNVGDYLLGEGYRLLAEMKVSSDCRAKMLSVAAQGHKELCLGQGNELSWMREPKPLSVVEVIDIFQKKTSPAFEVALKLGAILAGCSSEVNQVLKRYSQSLGIAYQINDDIDDFYLSNRSDDLNVIRPSVLAAIAYESASDCDKKLIESILNGSVKFDTVKNRVESLFEALKIEKKALDLMESYKSQAINSLISLDNGALKGLLRRVICRLFNDIELMGCCDDYKGRDVGRREQSEDNIK